MPETELTGQPRKRFVRFRLFASISIVAVFGAAGSARGAAPSLREQAARIGIQVGAAVNPAHFNEPPYALTLAREFNLVEPENVMKWPATEPARGLFNFEAADAVVAFAERHGMKVRGHNLVWSVHNPGWLTQGQFTPQQLSAILHNHILREVGHYAGRVFAWDVVNEAFDARGNLKHSIWYDQPGIGLAGRGTAYIERVFRWARAADPKALLFYNDYDAEGLNAKSDAIYAMVKDFKARGVPIDGVGLQMHIFNFDTHNLSSLSANMARLAALGVQVHITEMDVAIPIRADGRPANLPDLHRQAEIYRQVAASCVAQPACTAFQTWGVTDRYSWIPAATKGRAGAGLLFDQDYAAKPAYRAVFDVFSNAPARSKR
jgi:endo-1,4-beta-xylanase